MWAVCALLLWWVHGCHWHIGGWGWLLEWLQGPVAAAMGRWWVRLLLSWLWGLANVQEWMGLLMGQTHWSNRLDREFQNGVHQCWYYQGNLRSYKWLPWETQSPGNVLTGSCLFGRCFKITKWVPFTYSSCAFQSGIFALVFVEWAYVQAL